MKACHSHGLIAQGRIGDRGHHHDWVSRDYLDIDCKATGCKYNAAEKCMVPSRAKIGATGSCTGFEAKPLPAKIDGD
jgi:hypothetical protein